MQRTDFVHVVELPIRWGDMDALGHVNNVQYFRYLESGRIGNSSLTLRCALFAATEPSLAAEGQAVIVWFDFAHQRSVRLPDQVREAIIAREQIEPEVAG